MTPLTELLCSIPFLIICIAVLNWPLKRLVGTTLFGPWPKAVRGNEALATALHVISVGVIPIIAISSNNLWWIPLIKSAIS